MSDAVNANHQAGSAHVAVGGRQQLLPSDNKNNTNKWLKNNANKLIGRYPIH